MARKQLADLVVEEAQREDPVPQDEMPVAAEGTPTQEAEPRPPLKAVESSRPDLPEVGEHQPKYLRLVRKEARLREDQVLGMDRLVLRLNRVKPRGAGERLTLNTLLRLGADLVLERQEKLAGATEEELLDSLRESQTL